MPERKRHITFSRCPIEPHKGERWEKLEKVDISQPVVLVDWIILNSDHFYGHTASFNVDGKLMFEDYEGKPFNAISDTFPNITDTQWRKLMEHYYGIDLVLGIVSLFKQGYSLFTTFRAYSVEDHLFYKQNKGKEFWIKEVE